ncbi:DUF2330 domain-containing protein [Waterburya agarophytonicola K14]|uniref:DUF2330 domain-containing protein n=1 Tax=Waterburya agarophytonicola KI4 TaxID=2874699 RepID=A0A964FH35_9CYAN|nr:DUF2330 domain-containing protein [Waterburya agarophytonicola]MCC0178662.1 DUF2330 domain-containing protein [Waterburya agarophytonicola KI4]
MKTIRILLSCILTGAILIFGIKPALAFCGFYVAKADSSLYNQASQVIIARDEQRTVLTMSNDYQGEVKDFAMVVPVPVVLKEEQVHIGESKILERLDGFSAPRLVEYFDEDPCQPQYMMEDRARQSVALPQSAPMAKKAEAELGVTIEEQFSVGEYDILILSAKESDGLETWLIQNDYKIPQGAKELLQPYIKQNLKFFVAKVNLEEFDTNGFEKLRPISIAFESPKFMLPIRLGMMNANGDQDLLVYLLSPKGKVELTNYRTVKMPSDRDIPQFIKEDFKDFYTAMFQKTYEEENKQVAFLEYAWDMGSCDPCSAEPLNQEELKQAGVFWLDSNNFNNRWGGSNVFITRLHVRYSRDKFPEDLKFQSTSDRNLFQGRYVIRHPYEGEFSCKAGKEYKKSVLDRQESEAKILANLTGWKLKDIRDRINFVEAEPIQWWENLWN